MIDPSISPNARREADMLAAIRTPGRGGKVSGIFHGKGPKSRTHHWKTPNLIATSVAVSVRAEVYRGHSGTQPRTQRKEGQVKRKGVAAEVARDAQLEAIKKAGIVAMFADDELMDLLVLKGGNAIDLVLQVNSRASVDLDFSMGDDLDCDQVRPKVERALQSTFDLHGYVAFDVTMSPRPGKMPDELAAFWGGYLVEFKLISKQRAAEVERDLDTMRREAIRLGEGSKFTIDISRHEYVEGKREHELDGYRIYVYSPEMIVCEKLRAICQQMAEYGQIIKRHGLGNQRARDFVDIEGLVKKFAIDLTTERAKHIVAEMFALKRVPLELLGLMAGTRDFHALGYDEVKASMRPGVKLKPFDHYFEFVIDQCVKLETMWHMKSPSTAE